MLSGSELDWAVDPSPALKLSFVVGPLMMSPLMMLIITMTKALKQSIAPEI